MRCVSKSILQVPVSSSNGGSGAGFLGVFFLSLIYRLEKCAVSHFQGDKEVELGLPFSPLCDRNTTMIAQSQIGKDSGGHSKYKLKMKHRLWINLGNSIFAYKY